MISKTAIIRKLRKQDVDEDRPLSDQIWGLYSHEGKLLGRHPTKESAEDQEKAIQIRKHSLSRLARYLEDIAAILPR